MGVPFSQRAPSGEPGWRQEALQGHAVTAAGSARRKKTCTDTLWGWRDELGRACWAAPGCSGTGTQEQRARHVQAPMVGGSRKQPVALSQLPW